MANRHRHGYEHEQRPAYDTYQNSYSNSDRHSSPNQAYQGKRNSTNEYYTSQNRQPTQSRHEGEKKRDSADEYYASRDRQQTLSKPESARERGSSGRTCSPQGSYKYKTTSTKHSSPPFEHRPRRESNSRPVNRHGKENDADGDDDDSDEEDPDGVYGFKKNCSPAASRRDSAPRHGPGSHKSPQHDKMPASYNRHNRYS